MEGQRKLLDSKVLIIGAGGLGAPSSIYLAAAGVGTIGVIDADRVDRSNLHRQVITLTVTWGVLRRRLAKNIWNRSIPM